MILFDDSYLIRGKSFAVNEHVIVNNPSLEEIFEFGEEKYYALVSALVAKPSDYKVLLYDKGIDFETVNEFDFFCTAVNSISRTESAILFGELDFSAMRIYVDNRLRERVIGDGEVFIDPLSYAVITDFIRRINGIPVQKPETYLNEHVKQYRLGVERDNMKRKKSEPFKSMLLPLVSSYVNCPESRYGYETVMKLTISQLHDGTQRVMKRVHYDNVMRGLYAGTIAQDKLNLDEINWLV